jgi:hypothetical protein
MKKIILFLTLITFGVYSCKKEPQKKQTEPQNVSPNTNNTSKLVAAVAHYICPNNCKGGTSVMAGTCPICSSTLTHNQAFHNTVGSKSKAGFSPVAPPNIPVPNLPAPVTQPGPNYAGQYHYTCSSGCVKGGDTPGKCSNCSGNLVHNAAFHQ